MELLANAIGRVDFFPTDRVVALSLFGEPLGLEFRELFVQLLEAVDAEQLGHCLTDFTSMFPLPAENAHWLGWTWFPAMRSAGWRQWALVEPASVLALAQLRDFEAHFALQEVETRRFRTAREARRWLRTASTPLAF